jgi:hypothetical protein
MLGSFIPAALHHQKGKFEFSSYSKSFHTKKSSDILALQVMRKSSGYKTNNITANLKYPTKACICKYDSLHTFK